MALIGSIIDDFNDGTRAAVWSATYGEVTETNGRTQIQSTTGWNALSSDYLYTLVGSELVVEAFPADGTGHTSEAWSNMQISGSLNSTRLVIECQRQSGDVRFSSDVDWYDPAGTYVPYDPTSMRWWRIREAAGTVYFDTSPDGTTWTNRKNIPTPAWVTDGVDTLRAHFETHQDAGSSVMEIDNVNNPPAAEPAPEPTPATNTVVDFTAPRADSALSALSFGSCISTYSGDGQNVNIIKGTTTESAAWRDKLGELGPVAWRIPLAWNGGTPGSSAGGARSYGDADEYVAAIKAIGGTPIIAVGGTTGDNDILAADAAALVRYFNDNGGQNGGPVTNWIIGNEPDNGFGVTNYINGSTDANGVKVNDSFNAIADAMRAASTQTISIAGPSLVTYADYKEADYNAFFDTCGAKIDVVDFHMYDGANLANYTAAMTWFRNAIASRPSMAGRVKVHCGEYNWHPFYDAASTTHNASHFYTSRNTVAGAISTGRVVQDGGRAYQYADNNGPLGMITPGNGLNGAPEGSRIPMPAFYGVKMWSGGDLFRRPTGDMATCSTTLTDVEVFASTGDKNIMVVNKSETTNQAVEITLTGAPTTGQYEVWQTAKGMDPADVTGPQWQNPTRVASGSYSGGVLTVNAPSLTVSTIVVSTGVRAQPWELVTVPGVNSSTWSRKSGPSVPLSVVDRDVNFIAPPSMTDQTLVLDNKGREVVVTIQAASHGIKQADGSVLPCRLGRFPIPADPVLPAHNPTPDLGYRQATVNVPASVRSSASTTINTGGTTTTKAFNLPAGVQAGDLLVAYLSVSTGTLPDAATLAPAGWTELGRVVPSTANIRHVAFYRVATATEPASYNYGSLPTTVEGATLCAAVKDWSGVTTELGTTANGGFALSANTNTTLNAPSVTPATSRSLLLTTIASSNSAGATWGWIPPGTAGVAQFSHNTPNYYASQALGHETYEGTTATGTRTWQANTASTQTLYMASALTVPSGTKTATITEMLASEFKTLGEGGALTDATGLTFQDSTGLSSTYHLYAAGLDWTKDVGLMVYTDGSAEYGLANPETNYLLAGMAGLVAVAKRHNMVLLTPRAPGDGCTDGDGVCWYASSLNGVTAHQKLEWSNELIRWVMTRYNIDRRRIALGGYSSGAQWCTAWWGPKYASDIMVDGTVVAISYGGQPQSTPKLTDAYKAAVEYVWDTGDADTSYTQPTWDNGIQTGRAWYQSNGFAVTDLITVPGVPHERYGAGAIGTYPQIMDREVLKRVPASGVVEPTTGLRPVVYRSHTATTKPSGTTDKTAYAPPIIREGDLILALLSVYAGTVDSAALPAGFTLLLGHTRSTSHRAVLGYKIATATEPASYTPTLVGTQSYRMDLICLGNVDTTRLGTPTMVTTTGSTTTHAAPGVTPNTSNGMLVSWMTGGGGNVWNPPTGMDEITDDNTAASHYLSQTLGMENRTTNTATGTRTFTITTPLGGAYTHIGGSIFLPSLGSS